MEPTLVILFASAGAALAGVVGVAPLSFRASVPEAWIGWSDAISGGMMLGLAYLLVTDALEETISGGVGILLGILFIFATRAAVASGEAADSNGHQVFLLAFLHSASEGVAIAAAWATDVRFGGFMALAVAVHNIPEGTLLGEAQRRRGLGMLRAAAIVLTANSSQILLAVATYSIAVAAPGALAWITGFAAGALLHLVMDELLPDAYRYAGATSIAVVTAIAMGVVVLGGGLLL